MLRPELVLALSVSVGPAMATTLPRHAILGVDDLALLRETNVPQVSYKEAAEVTQLHPEILQQLVRFKILPGVVRGDFGTVDVDKAAQLAAQFAAARAPVEGNPITLSEAAEKYKFDRKSVHAWMTRGWVRVLVEEYPVKVNEGDVAFARALADLQGHLRGKAVFPSKPRPGRPKKS